MSVALAALPVPSLFAERGDYLVNPQGHAPWEALNSLRDWIVHECTH